jgi:hypothetical protein
MWFSLQVSKLILSCSHVIESDSSHFSLLRETDKYYRIFLLALLFVLLLYFNFMKKLLYLFKKSHIIRKKHQCLVWIMFTAPCWREITSSIIIIIIII